MAIILYIKVPYPYLVREQLYEVSDTLYKYGIEYTVVVIEDSINNPISKTVLEYIQGKGAQVRFLSANLFSEIEPESNKDIFIDLPEVEQLVDLVTYIISNKVQTIRSPYNTYLDHPTVNTVQELAHEATEKDLFYQLGDKVLLGAVGMSSIILTVLLAFALTYQKKRYRRSSR